MTRQKAVITYKVLGGFASREDTLVVYEDGTVKFIDARGRPTQYHLEPEKLKHTLSIIQKIEFPTLQTEYKG
jgi:hypothetical protein